MQESEFTDSVKKVQEKANRERKTKLEKRNSKFGIRRDISVLRGCKGVC
jgi:hypothetical protein